MDGELVRPASESPRGIFISGAALLNFKTVFLFLFFFRWGVKCLHLLVICSFVNVFLSDLTQILVKLPSRIPRAGGSGGSRAFNLAPVCTFPLLEAHMNAAASCQGDWAVRDVTGRRAHLCGSRP